MKRCKWFSIQCDESVDSSDTAQLAVFIQMVFVDFITTRGVFDLTSTENYSDNWRSTCYDRSSLRIYCALQSGPRLPKFLNYHCIIHQQVLVPVVKTMNSIRVKAKQHRTFELFLEECSAEYGDLLHHNEVRWLRHITWVTVHGIILWIKTVT